MSPGSLTATGSPPGPAPHRSTHRRVSRSATDSPAPGTARPTTCCTSLSQIRLDTEGRAYYRRKLAAGKTRMEAMRCLKRRIADAVYRQLVADARVAESQGTGTGPGGHCGASLTSSAVDLPPHIDTSDQPLPGPAEPTLQPRRQGRKKAPLSANR